MIVVVCKFRVRLVFGVFFFIFVSVGYFFKVIVIFKIIERRGKGFGSFDFLCVFLVRYLVFFSGS